MERKLLIEEIKAIYPNNAGSDSRLEVNAFTSEESSDLVRFNIQFSVSTSVNSFLNDILDDPQVILKTADGNKSSRIFIKTGKNEYLVDVDRIKTE